MSRTVKKVCGGWWVVGGGVVGWWWLRPILVFSLILDQAEQNHLATDLPIVYKFKFVLYGHLKKKIF